MRVYHATCIVLLLIFVHSTTHMLSKQKKSAHTIRANEDKKYAILFDLTNVLIKENSTGFAKQIGYGTIARYTLTHWKHPGYRCLDMLAAMSTHDMQKPHITITLNKRTLPRCLVELQEGNKSCAQAKAEIMECIEYLDSKKFFSGVKEKNLMITIMNLVLDPATIATIIEPIKTTVQLAQKLKAAGHAIYIFANAPDELHTILQQKYPDMIQLFDGIVLSSHVKKVKPDQAMFNHVLCAHNLEPHDCIVIDSLEETVAAAKKLGMQAFVYDKNVTSRLRKYGIKI